MYGNFVLLENAGKPEKGRRVYVGEIKKRDEAWLRDILFEHPDIIPVNELDATFGPLIPLCKELRTEAGPVDAVFINEQGRLTILECKLWKNPQARREVIAQTLHYVSALTGWSYADLQRQTSAAVGRPGLSPFEIVRKAVGDGVKEQEFVDSASRALREGRFLVLLAGDGIREGLQSLAELVNRNASKAFTFGLIEVALFQFGPNKLAIQPRVLATTETITRHMTVVNASAEQTSVVMEEPADTSTRRRKGGAEKRHLRDWWQPVLRMQFDDPEQEPPFWSTTNNVVLNTPFPGIQIKAFAMVDSPRIGVFLSGTRRNNLLIIQKELARERQALLRDLPRDTEVIAADCVVALDEFSCTSDAQKHEWLRKTLNAFANALRPRLRKWYAQR